MNGEVATAFESLAKKALPQGFGIMCPAVPASTESIEAAIDKEINMRAALLSGTVLNPSKTSGNSGKRTLG